MTERERITAGDVWFDEMPDFGPWQKKRPVVIELSTTYVVWIDEGYSLDYLRRDGLIHERVSPEDAVDWGIRVDAPDRWELDRLYSDLETDYGPNDQIQGPTWYCPHPLCANVQPAGAPWPRRHGVHCPHATEAVAA